MGEGRTRKGREKDVMEQPSSYTVRYEAKRKDTQKYKNTKAQR